ncbi:hypothetical protein PRUB_a4154 [Pseudoalteromonas rubra]|uniref:Uncharacterized protein n=1 Tax=Pseudoalteromonas rubra TaxID=43658 RepID=A0A8T0C4C1_9GAMM|nr:hypothetical protein PRUB_a4154 [Pseudoalteromonas rubra]
MATRTLARQITRNTPTFKAAAQHKQTCQSPDPCCYVKKIAIF